MKRTMFALALLGTVAVTLPALAQGYGWSPYAGRNAPGWGPMMGWSMMGPGNADAPGRGRFTMIDANQDGVVTAEEASSSADEVFTAMDADDNGELTKDEYMSVRMGYQQGWNTDRQAAMQSAKEARFAALDTDGNGTVSRAEFQGAAKAHFDAADADSDGKVSPWEFRGAAWN